NQSTAHASEMSVDVLDAPFRAADAEMPDDERLHIAHEGAAAADDHLREQRLTLFQGHAAVAADGLIPPVLGQPEVIHCMAGLMQRAEQTREEIVGIESRGDPNIAGDSFREGVLAFVHAATIEGEADLLHHFHDERALLCWREFPAERRRRPALLEGDCLAD